MKELHHQIEALHLGNEIMKGKAQWGNMWDPRCLGFVGLQIFISLLFMPLSVLVVKRVSMFVYDFCVSIYLSHALERINFLLKEWFWSTSILYQLWYIINIKLFNYSRLYELKYFKNRMYYNISSTMKDYGILLFLICGYSKNTKLVIICTQKKLYLWNLIKIYTLHVRTCDLLHRGSVLCFVPQKENLFKAQC